MFAFIIKAFAITASFRIPENHTFQQTLPLPPMTTLTGLMGAALGLSFEEAMKFREANKILFGVIGSHKGEMRDLWKYNKLESDKKEREKLIKEFLTDLMGELEKGAYPIFRKDVLIREFLIEFSLLLAVGSEDKTTLTKVRDSFCNPVYALTAGNSDDLLKICKISDIIDTIDELYSDFENTILPGDQTQDYKPPDDFLKNTPITYTIRAPQVHLLPTAFKFNGEERRVIERKQFTFVGSPIRLKNSITTHNIEGIRIVLL